MRRVEALLMAMLAGVAVVVLCHRASRRSTRPAQDPTALRDTLNGGPPADLAQRHAGLAPEGKAGCAVCHVPHRGARIKPAWAGGLAARLAGVASQAGLQGFAGEAGAEVYTAVPSGVCLSCHDGTYGRGGAAGHGSHPVGVDYRMALASDPSAYNPPDGGRAIRLEDGTTVGCISCHQLHGATAASSPTGVRKSSCQACHRL